MVTLDLLGIGVFAASGALAAVRARLDVFGVTVLGVITALGGGTLRDVLLGITPPVTLRGWPYLVVPALTALVVSRFHPGSPGCAARYCSLTPWGWPCSPPRAPRSRWPRMSRRSRRA